MKTKFLLSALATVFAILLCKESHAVIFQVPDQQFRQLSDHRLQVCRGSVTLSSGSGTIYLPNGCSNAASVPYCNDTTSGNNPFSAVPGSNSIAITGVGSDVIQCVVLG
jgi:hypothetical protein